MDAINAIAAVGGMPELAGSQAAAPSGAFGTWFSQQLDGVNQQLLQAELGMQQLAAGASGNVHAVMIDLEQAKLALQLLVQVRTHALEAYQEVLRMQV
jgi:flagellar hook-basal body complex protein FliE